ncbi:MAG TPA: 2-amino-4-hydroxy-6-hydroxymethyldihydropteridine diphosphokinase [Vicinamibacterales bacterium]|nr:2-amino-4-hydroxy-6-hydroxymethyldihydropteridine diphosphokinase [Vicinamibacterales bacterium]
MRVVIALGSNLGDRPAALDFAIDRLSRLIANLTISSFIETDPEGKGLQDQPRYLNAVVVGETTLGAREMLDHLLAIERAYGRERPYTGAPRTLDLDLILLGDTIEHAPDLQVPHPRFRERLFVLGPLSDVAPGITDPETGLTAFELLARLKKRKGPEASSQKPGAER